MLGISQGQAQGQTEPGITASVAIESAMQVADVRHRPHTMRLETFVEDLARLILRQAAMTKPVVMAHGKKIDFEVVARALAAGRVAAYPVSGLPQSIPGRKQEIEDRYKRGQINRAMYARLLNLPTTDQESDEETSGIDLVYAQLDVMERTGTYQPPSSLMDLASAKELAVKRYNIRARQKLAKGSKVKSRTLQLLSQYIGQVQEMIDDAAPPAPGPQGPTAPAGAPAAPPAN
jgi:hypothetical protein